MSEPTTPDVIVCAMCGKPMTLGTADTNEAGRLVHSECYLEQLLARQMDPLKAAWTARNRA